MVAPSDAALPVAARDDGLATCLVPVARPVGGRDAELHAKGLASGSALARCVLGWQGVALPVLGGEVALSAAKDLVIGMIG